MTSKTPRHRPKASAAADDIDALYLALLRSFYEEENREKAQEVARRLEAVLADQPDFADSIRGEEVRSLLAELGGNLTQAARSRESEIRKILELHLLTQNTPHWRYVVRRY